MKRNGRFILRSMTAAALSGGAAALFFYFVSFGRADLPIPDERVLLVQEPEKAFVPEVKSGEIVHHDDAKKVQLANEIAASYKDWQIKMRSLSAAQKSRSIEMGQYLRERDRLLKEMESLVFSWGITPYL